jgi:hypothetical protein
MRRWQKYGLVGAVVGAVGAAVFLEANGAGYGECRREDEISSSACAVAHGAFVVGGAVIGALAGVVVAKL